MKKLIKISALILALVMSVSLMLSCDDEGSGNYNPDDTGSTENPGGTDDTENPGEGTDDTETPGGNTDSTPDAEIGSDIGDLAAPFNMDRVDGSGKVNVKDYRGKAVIVNFWGTWCGPCKSELPEFDELATDYADDVVIIAIHSTSGSENAPSYIAENYSDSKIIFAYDVVLDEYTDMYYDALGGVGYYPYTVVLDKNGIITYKQSGAMSYEQLKTQVDAALAK